jgi:hypothetical protein
MVDFVKEVRKTHKILEEITRKKIELTVKRREKTRYDDEIFFGTDETERNHLDHTDETYGNFLLNWIPGKEPSLHKYALLTLLHEWGHALDSTPYKRELNSEDLFTYMTNSKDICLFFVSRFYLELSAWYFSRTYADKIGVLPEDFVILNSGNIQVYFNNEIMELAKKWSKENELNIFLKKNDIDKDFLKYSEEQLLNLYEKIKSLYIKMKPSI